jgi:hypothetical protein
MKDFFTTTFRGNNYEFVRVLSSSLDPWYHISVTLNNVAIKCRMHTDKEGNWKITDNRLPRFLFSLEGEFNELIKLNEKPAQPGRFHKS